MRRGKTGRSPPIATATADGERAAKDKRSGRVGEVEGAGSLPPERSELKHEQVQFFRAT